MPTANKPNPTPRKDAAHPPDWLLDAWPFLSDFQRVHIAGRVFIRPRPHLRPMLSLYSMAGLLAFSLLGILPVHPMTIPIAFGGGIAGAIIVRTMRVLLFT